MFYHANIPGPSGGFVGVDVFFVISGYLITMIVVSEIAKGQFSLLSFYERRARRILPALTGVTLATFVIGWFTLLPAEMKSFGQSAVATAVFLSNFHFAATLDYFSPGAEFSPLLHTWSLAVEEQFYLFFPPLLIFLFWMRWLRPVWVVAGASFFSLILAWALLPSKPHWVFFLLPFRAWELGAGAMLALASPKVPNIRAVQEGLAAAGLGAILVPVFVLDSTTPFPALAAVPPVLGASILIWIGSRPGSSFVNAALSNTALVRVGLLSYSLYLWHWPILAFLRIALETATLPVSIALGGIALSTLVAWVSYRFIETPFRARSTRGLEKNGVFAFSALSLFTVVALGWTVQIADGFPGRLPPSASLMAGYAHERTARREECFDRPPVDGLCSIGTKPSDEVEIDFLLWGDSHADAFMPGMKKVAERVDRSGVFAGSSGCPPILDIQRVSNGRACSDFNDSVWAWLEGRSDVGLVILAARWTLSVEGTRYRGEAGKDVRLGWRGTSAAHPGNSENASLVEAGLNTTVAKIRETGRRVVLLGPVPEIGRNVPTASARKSLLPWLPAASVTRQDFEARAGRTEQLLRRVADTHNDVEYLRLSDLFCGKTRCRTTNGTGQPLYIDDDHISRIAATELLPRRLDDIWSSDLETVANPNQVMD
jgi:peptidoglycan/LPS O-acetylase OafA/YrhL